MSLLLEALKKAEKAKEEAQRRARGETQEPQSAPSQPSEPRQPLQILPEEAQATHAEPVLALADDRPAPEPVTQPRPQSRAEVRAAERTAARKVFEAKFREPNPRLPFFITLGALGAFAIGTVAYFWIQLRPPAPLVNLNPKPPSGEAQVAAAPPPAAPVLTSAPASQSGIPGLPSASATPAPQASAPQTNAPRPAPKPAPRPSPAAREPEIPRLKPQPRTIAPAPSAPTTQTEITATRAAPQVHAKVSSAYAAYLAGDLPTARADYEQALREEPSNRDALLGLAALDVRAGRWDAADAAYRRLLQADPRDAHAHAGLIALRAGRVDPVAAESRVKVMLADNPGAHVLNFTLGNQFAQQGRWAEAQQEYFKAYAAEPDNPDFAYNLAVSLDQLRQPTLALQYYERAIALAKARGASFDLAAAQKRAAQLPAPDPSRR
jgi:tetratricopeptide (TPR) repeat protein